MGASSSTKNKSSSAAKRSSAGRQSAQPQPPSASSSSTSSDYMMAQQQRQQRHHRNHNYSRHHYHNQHLALAGPAYGGAEQPASQYRGANQRLAWRRGRWLAPMATEQPAAQWAGELGELAEPQRRPPIAAFERLGRARRAHEKRHHQHYRPYTPANELNDDEIENDDDDDDDGDEHDDRDPLRLASASHDAAAYATAATRGLGASTFSVGASTAKAHAKAKAGRALKAAPPLSAGAAIGGQRVVAASAKTKARAGPGLASGHGVGRRQCHSRRRHLQALADSLMVGCSSRECLESVWRPCDICALAGESDCDDDHDAGGNSSSSSSSAISSAAGDDYDNNKTHEEKLGEQAATIARLRARARKYYIPAVGAVGQLQHQARATATTTTLEDSGRDSQGFEDNQLQLPLTEQEILNRVRNYPLGRYYPDTNAPELSNQRQPVATVASTRNKLPAATKNPSAETLIVATMTTTTNNNNINTNHNGTQQLGSQNNKAQANMIPCYKMPSHERGLALSQQERESHGLLGLLPAAHQDQELQARAVMNFLDHCQDPLSKYVYLRHLKDFNEKLFYFTLIHNVEKCMPLVYTPTVGLACQKFSEIYMRPRGLFITANDFGRIRQILANWPERDVRVIVVTDGERILGLGDLGANGMGISIGKLSLYTALAGIPPQNVLPITIDVGTNNETFLKDPFYIGLRQARVRGQKYEQLMEEFMRAVVERWGRSCLVQFEDFANATAFTLLSRYRDDYCTFNDDIQGTASVCLSGLISASKLVGKRLRDCSFLFYGAGEANLGTAHLLVMAMMEDGLGEQEAKRHIWLVDSKGLVTTSRQDLSDHKREFAQDAAQLSSLEEIIGLTKPSAIIGASAQGGSFTESICKKMAQFNERPIIFALSNPTSKAECTADQAYKWTDGKCVFASGSPFEPVEYKGKTYVTGQGNNAYIFPAVGLAAIGAHTHIIPEETFLMAARALSDMVTSADFEVGLVYPRLSKIRDVTLRVATRVLEYFYRERLATFRPEPNDKLEFLKGIQYDARY